MKGWTIQMSNNASVIWIPTKAVIFYPVWSGDNSNEVRINWPLGNTGQSALYSSLYIKVKDSQEKDQILQELVELFEEWDIEQSNA